MNTITDIISSCHPTYVFSDRIPEEDTISAIITAGNQAPFPPPQPAENETIRRFFVFRTGTVKSSELEQLCLSAVEKSLEELESFFGWRAYTPEGPGSYIQILKNYQITGITGFKSAPYIILATEPRRFPPTQQESLACVTSFMWVMASSLSLGFHIIPGISYLARSSDLVSLLDLAPGKYAVTGVAIGYPHEELVHAPSARESVSAARWFV